ncbi:hypothetical protein MO867_06020 [Microbulbifer sp. OS29]|uniref:Uncharacterized protein n=1 Tax=Microbulbifer okhotskensis TaxID=2926617 RepID=A0A9X2EQJ2_9GAMM|nr:hypothetical protein [Microbulbifer okhotskensis]MCO1333893.1 hypothetical protein [Microbulbifer okhotskensis]
MQGFAKAALDTNQAFVDIVEQVIVAVAIANFREFERAGFPGGIEEFLYSVGGAVGGNNPAAAILAGVNCWIAGISSPV